jgi:uncharacterized membrane protein HdeD (DUF308 family)
MNEDMLPPDFTYYGILMIILGIITFIVTYKHVIPTGSVFLVISGVFLIVMRRYGRNKDRQVHNT